MLLYCKDGVVVATHDETQGVPASAYGDGVSIIPWPTLSTLERVGEPPAPVRGRPDMRPYAAPVLTEPADLVAYANFVQWALATGGYTVTVAGQQRTFSTAVDSQIMLAGKAVRLSRPTAPTSLNWQFATGFVTLSATDFLAAADKIADFVQATFDTVKTVEAAILAGTITTTAQIDAAFAGVN